MKKQLLVIGLVTGLLVGLGTTAAQDVKHDVEIVIPAVLMIRFVENGVELGTASADAVSFTTTAAQVAAGDTVDPDPVALNWDDIRVFANTFGNARWQILVATNNDDFDWGKVWVTPSNGDVSVDPFSLPVNASWQIYGSDLGESTDPEWSSLGIGPASYKLHLDATEGAGRYETTVTYTIADL